MFRRMVIIFLSLFFLTTGFACSKSSKDEKKEGAIEKFTEETAAKGLEAIQNPINNAKAVQSMSEDRQKMMEESMEGN